MKEYRIYRKNLRRNSIFKLLVLACISAILLTLNMDGEFILFPVYAYLVYLCVNVCGNMISSLTCAKEKIAGKTMAERKRPFLSYEITQEKPIPFSHFIALLIATPGFMLIVYGYMKHGSACCVFFGALIIISGIILKPLRDIIRMYPKNRINNPLL